MMVSLCKTDDVPEGRMRHFELMGYDILLVHNHGQFYATDAACTVSWAMLADGTLDAENNAVTCSQCGSVFDLQSGQPKTGPAKFPLTVYEAVVNGDEVTLNFTY